MWFWLDCVHIKAAFTSSDSEISSASLSNFIWYVLNDSSFAILKSSNFCSFAVVVAVVVWLGP